MKSHTFNAETTDSQPTPVETDGQMTSGRLPSGTPDRIRTCDLLIRSQSLYPAELRAHTDSGRRKGRQSITLLSINIFLSHVKSFFDFLHGAALLKKKGAADPTPSAFKSGTASFKRTGAVYKPILSLEPVQDL